MKIMVVNSWIVRCTVLRIFLPHTRAFWSPHNIGVSNAFCRQERPRVSESGSFWKLATRWLLSSLAVCAIFCSCLSFVTLAFQIWIHQHKGSTYLFTYVSCIPRFIKWCIFGSIFYFKFMANYTMSTDKREEQLNILEIIKT